MSSFYAHRASTALLSEPSGLLVVLRTLRHRLMASITVVLLKAVRVQVQPVITANICVRKWAAHDREHKKG
jgi:hypothetical protein